MQSFLINGKNRLYGKVRVDCSKNAVLPILAASIMCKGKVILNNITYYEDIINMLEILKHLGVFVLKKENSLILDNTNINNNLISIDLSNKIRASIFFLGPLVSIFKKARVAYPGGCSIGVRPVDIHIKGLQKLGAKVIDRHGIINVFGENMISNNITMPFPSVGATENLIMSSIFLKGTTTITGVAKEPEIVDLCMFLNKAGAKICGAGTDVIHIEGISELKGVEYSPIPDRIVAGTYLLAPLITGGTIEIENSNPKHIKSILDLVNNNTCKIFTNDDKIIVESKKQLLGFDKIETLPYPFFPTDMQQPFSSLASTCNGNTIIVENLFENRFKHVSELVKMGAKILVKDRTCFIEGQNELYGACVTAPDLRGGVALVLAGLGANGYTTISNVELIDRGYYKLEEKLKQLGADIKRIII